MQIRTWRWESRPSNLVNGLRSEGVGWSMLAREPRRSEERLGARPLQKNVCACNKTKGLSLVGPLEKSYLPGSQKQRTADMRKRRCPFPCVLPTPKKRKACFFRSKSFSGAYGITYSGRTGLAAQLHKNGKSPPWRPPKLAEQVPVGTTPTTVEAGTAATWCA